MPDTTDIPPLPDTSPDPFFVLKDCRELFTQRLTDLARQCGIIAPRVIETMSREIGEAHDELASAQPQEGFEQTNGLTASRISLVGNDDLELDIRITDIVTHLRDDEQIDHWRAQLRYMTLLHRTEMTPDENPLGLEPIRRGLWAMCHAFDGSLDQKFDRLERLEEMLKLKLPEIYAELNRLLENRGVRPAQPRLVRQAAGPVAAAQDRTGGNALSMLQQSVQQQTGGSLPFPLPGTFPAAAPGGAPGQEGNMALAATTMVMMQHLMERLNTIELQQASASLSAQTGIDAPPRVIRSKDLDLPAGQPTAIALDTLSLIFEAIFSVPDIPDAVKSLLGRLQMPLLKQAIVDPAFFGNTQHPARRLFDRVARASLGLPADTPRSHSLLQALSRLVDAARNTLEDIHGDLSPHLAELDALIKQRDDAVLAAAHPYALLLTDYEKRERALGDAREWLNRTRNRTTEPEILRFLSSHWLRFMQAAALSGGREGSDWKDGENTAEALLWSIQPKPTPEERQKLTALIPALIKKLNAGLDRLGVPAEDRKPFLDACFALQTGALRGRPISSSAPTEATSAAPSPANVPPPSDTPSQARILEKDGKILHYHGQGGRPATHWNTARQNVQTGDWLALSVAGGKSLSGLCCGQDAESKTMLIFNPDWGYAVALAPTVVEQQLQAKKARIVSGVSLFDVAAEQALGRLKTGK